MKVVRAREEDAVNQQDAERIMGLAFAPDAVFWRECFLRSACTREKSPQAVVELGTRAEACGRTYGRAVRAGGRDISQLCRDNGLAIRELAVPKSPGMEVFALFEPPDAIYVRTALLAGCDRLIRDSGMDAVLGRFCCMDVVLCHEFFHFLEMRHRESIFTRTYREPVGPFKRRAQLPPLGEIAAMGFAREVLGLKWSPFLLDCILLGIDDAPSALALLGRLERSAAEYEALM